MEKYQISGKIIKPFSGIIEAESEGEALETLDNPEQLYILIIKGNLSVKGTKILKKKLSRVPDTTVINYY